MIMKVWKCDLLKRGEKEPVVEKILVSNWREVLWGARPPRRE